MTDLPSWIPNTLQYVGVVLCLIGYFKYMNSTFWGAVWTLPASLMLSTWSFLIGAWGYGIMNSIIAGMQVISLLTPLRKDKHHYCTSKEDCTITITNDPNDPIKKALRRRGIYDAHAFLQSIIHPKRSKEEILADVGRMLEDEKKQEGLNLTKPQKRQSFGTGTFLT